jgi:hypothetical protein
MADQLITWTLTGAPRTKKTSNRIVQVKGKDGARGFTKILPSEAHQEWFKAAMQQAPGIRLQLSSAGIGLPLEGWLQVRATFFRDRESGDLLGYLQAIADWMQEPKCNVQGRTVRNGAGIIHDDVQIRSWDGSRLAKDASCPRIEVEISVLSSRPVAGELFAEEIW